MRTTTDETTQAIQLWLSMPEPMRAFVHLVERDGWTVRRDPRMPESQGCVGLQWTRGGVTARTYVYWQSDGPEVWAAESDAGEGSGADWAASVEIAAMMAAELGYLDTTHDQAGEVCALCGDEDTDEDPCGCIICASCGARTRDEDVKPDPNGADDMICLSCWERRGGAQ